MNTPSNLFVRAIVWSRHILSLCICCALSTQANAAGTAVGTIIENTASIDYVLAGTPITLQSNTTTIVVAERINVVVTLQSPQTLVTANDVDQTLLFTLTNTGNGTETFSLFIDSAIAGDDFDPVPSVPSIYFDTDDSGDFNTGDVAYVPGANDPDLLPDEAINVFLVNDIPAAVVNGNIGRSQLTATSATGSGVPGTVFANQGDGGVDAVIGATGGTDDDVGEYLVSDVLISVVKAQVVSDQFGGTEPIPGATLTYTISVDVASAGTATASIISDAIPALTTFVPNSITLNGAAITDVADADEGELNTAGIPTIVVRLGDLIQTDPVQVITFQVTID